MVVNSNKNDNKNINNDNDRVNTNVNIKIDLGQALQKPKRKVKRRKPKVKPEDLMKGMGGANFSGLAPVPLGATYMPSSSTYDTSSQLPAFRPQYLPQPPLMIAAPPALPSPAPAPEAPPAPPALPPAEQPRFIREGVLYDPKSKQTLVLPKAGETGKPALLDPISESRYLPMISEVEQTRREALAQMRATEFPPSIASPSAEFDIVFDSSGGLRTVPRLPPQTEVSPVVEGERKRPAQVSPVAQESPITVKYNPDSKSSNVVTQSGRKLFDGGNAPKGGGDPITTLEGKYYIGSEEVSKDFIKALTKERELYYSLSQGEKTKFTKGLSNEIRGYKVSKEVFDIYQKSRPTATAQQAASGGFSPASFDIFGAIGQALSSAVTGGIVKATTPLTAAIPSPAAGQMATPTSLRFPEGTPPPEKKKKQIQKGEEENKEE